MARVIVGIFHTYGQAQEAVRDLEIAGITGEQVEVIRGAEEDVRGVELEGLEKHAGADRANNRTAEKESSKQSISERIGHFFRSLTGSEETHVHDHYVEDHEFYSGEVRQGRTMLIVRPLSQQTAERAEELMRAHGGAGVTGQKKVRAASASGEPETGAPRVMGNVTSSIGDQNTTSGNYQDDLEGRGKEMRRADGRNVRVYATGAPLQEFIQTRESGDPRNEE